MALLRYVVIGLSAAALALAASPDAGPAADGAVGPPAGPQPVVAYRSPADGSVLRLFDPPAVRWGRGHRGVDLAVRDLTVHSPGPGVVSFSGTVVDRGVVTVLHPDGLRSSLEPVEDAPATGTPVAAGDPLGHVTGTSHCGGRACVHWGVRRGESYVNPLSLLGDTTVVLLP